MPKIQSSSTTASSTFLGSTWQTKVVLALSLNDDLVIMLVFLSLQIRYWECEETYLHSVWLVYVGSNGPLSKALAVWWFPFFWAAYADICKIKVKI